MNLCGELWFLTDEDRDETRHPPVCCAGAAMRGPDSCYCWIPVYDLRQRKPDTSIEPVTNAKACADCAYRVGSPERQRGDDLDALSSFWCHQGMRRPKAWRHPDGRVRSVDLAESPDYQPPIIAGVPYRADGHPAALCAGWAAVTGGR